MSWFTDPELFIYCRGWEYAYLFGIVRITKKYNVPLLQGDLTCREYLDFSKHLSLGNNINKESDYDALKSILRRNSHMANREKVMFVNCQGLVVYWDYSKNTGTWSRIEERDSIFYSLPGIQKPFNRELAKKLQSVEEKVSELVAENSLLKEKLNSEVTNLQEQLNQEKNDREVQVSDLTAILQEYHCAGSGELWMIGCKVPSHWVHFEELVVLNIPKDTPLTITKAPGAPEFAEDNTTNVQADLFRQGIFPIVVVNVADLNPNNGKARFDPDVWCSINSAGNCYAAQKPS